MASLEKRGRRWRARIHVNSIRDGKTFATKAEAAAWAMRREAELGRGKLPSKTLQDALARYAREVSPSKRGEHWELLRLRKWQQALPFRGRELAALTAADIASWRDQRLAGNPAEDVRAVTPGTVAREMNLLRSVLEIARREWGWLATNPATDVKRPPRPRARERRISDDELERLRMALGWPEDVPPVNATQRVAVALMFAVETGMRSGEITSLEWSQVSSRYVTLSKTKNGDARTVPLSRRAVELLSLLPRDGVLAFNLSPKIRDALFRKARAKARIEGLTFHDTRHEAISRLARKLDVLDLARMVGHRDLKSLLGYYNPTADELADRLG